jgi:hypothetical protein
VLNGLAWRNILAESYGRERTPARQLVAAYSGGIALNSFLPAQAGTFAYFGMFRVIIVGSAFAGILAAGVVQNLFYGVIGTLNYVFLFLSRPDSESTAEHQVTEDGGIKLVFLVLAAMLLLVVARFLWKRYHKVWDDAKAGAVILRRPRLYVTRVLSLQVASYVAGWASTPPSCPRSASR